MSSEHWTIQVKALIRGQEFMVTLPVTHDLPPDHEVAAFEDACRHLLHEVRAGGALK